MPTDIWTDSDTSYQCVGCTRVCPLYMGCCARVSLTEIRRNPFNYPPEQGPAFLSPLRLCYRIYLTPLLPLSPHLSNVFFPHSRCSSLPLHRAPCPLRFNYHFRLLIFMSPLLHTSPAAIHCISPRACFYLSSSQRIS